LDAHAERLTRETGKKVTREDIEQGRAPRPKVLDMFAEGVYFEAGYALGLNLPVIWCVQKEGLDNVQFDTRQYNHILWESEEDLKERLYYFICAVVGKVSKPSPET
jgi:hypothetical protein